MQRREYLRSTTATAAGAACLLAGCSSNKGTSPSKNSSNGTKTNGKKANGNVVKMTQDNDYYFNPIGLHVKKGDTVTWKIAKGSHSTTAYKKGNGPASVTRIPEGAKAWNSGILSQTGATFDHTFTTEGTYDYFCIPHKSLGMIGRIVVGKPGGPAEGSMPPDGNVPKSDTIVQKGSISYDEFKG